MKNIFLVLFVCLLTDLTYGQDKRSFNFIIVVDETIVPNLSNSRLLMKKENELLSTINIEYWPGNLSLTHTDYNLILNTDNDLYLKFDYYDYSMGLQKVYNYEIKIGKNWFEKSYLILKIYNTNKKKYRKIISPVKGTNYTFEIDYGGGSAIQIRRR